MESSLVAIADGHRVVTAHNHSVQDDGLVTSIEQHQANASAVPDVSKRVGGKEPGAKQEADKRHLLIVVGVTSFLVVILITSCCIAELFKSKSSEPGARDNRKKKNLQASFDDMPGNRKQHRHDGRVIYEWDQTLNVATIYIQVPGGLAKQDMEIKITTRRIQVGRKGAPPFMKEDTFNDIVEEDSAWRLRSNGELQIYLQKAEPVEWPHCLRHRSLGLSTVSSHRSARDRSPRSAGHSPRAGTHSSGTASHGLGSQNLASSGTASVQGTGRWFGNRDKLFTS
jgi:hypothetical protein